MLSRRLTYLVGLLLVALAQPSSAQQAVIQPDTARAQIRAVLRAFYRHLEKQNWDALSAYVLSPKLLERRGASGDLQMAVTNRTRGRGSSHMAGASGVCPSSSSPMVNEAAIRLDGDWAEVSVTRCNGTALGVDEFRMLYFEQRWRFIYTALFQDQPMSEAAER